MLPKNKRIRADANNLWHDDSEVIAYVSGLTNRLHAIEEPVKPFDYQSLSRISEKLNIPVILDESLCNGSHLSQCAPVLSSAIANIRVSKCGGILRSVELANQCVDAGFGVILGAQVGETSLLTRAALVVGNGMKKPPVAREGAYGDILLKQDICARSLRFGRYGALPPKYCDNHSTNGLGIEVNAESVSWLSER